MKENGLFSQEKKMPRGDFIALYNCLKRSCSKEGVGIFSHVKSDTTQGKSS